MWICYLQVLEWGGLSRTSAQWQHRWAVLHRGFLYLLPDQDAMSPAATHNIWRNRCAAPPPFSCQGWIPGAPTQRTL